MNVLIIAQYFPPDMGGASTRAFNVAKGLIDVGCTVKVIAAFPHYPEGKIPDYFKGKALTFEKKGGIQIIRVWIPSLPHNSIFNRITLHLCFMFSSLFALPFSGKKDVIFASNPNLFSFFSALVYSFIGKKPIIRNVDDLWPEVFYDMNLVKSGIAKMFLDFIALLSYSIPAAITPISPAYKRLIVEKYGVRENKIKVIEVGVDTSIFSKYIRNDQDEFIVMYSGVLGSAYDFTTILQTAKELSNHRDIKFIIRGVGESESYIKRMIYGLSLENVVLDTNLVTKFKLVEILNSADIFLLPMKKIKAADDGLPTKIFEYQAVGKPIICSSNGMPGKYVNQTQSGIVVETGDHKALAEAIAYLYKNPEIAMKYGENGKRYVKQNLSLEKIGQQIIKILNYGI